MLICIPEILSKPDVAEALFRLLDIQASLKSPGKIIITSGHVKIRPEDLPVDGKFFAKPYDASKVVSTLRSLVEAA